jgi:heme exporter protein A
MIKVRGLEKRFGHRPVLQNLDFDLEPGEFSALLGPNGVGKTTFLQILASLSSPTRGIIQIASFRVPEQIQNVRRHIGLVSHQPFLYRELTGEENLNFFCRLYRVENSRAKTEELLDLLNLSGRKLDPVRTYSRGMLQRLSVARALVHSPGLLLLDEPFTGLDQESGQVLETTLRTLAESGVSIIMTSHNLIRVSNLVDRVDILSGGKISATISNKNSTLSQLMDTYQAAVQTGGNSP